ncbi:ParB/RepB/Spo0J family partition protein [Streptomyces sp. NPDC003395]
MSKADSLGSAPAFDRTRGASSRRHAINRTIGREDASAAAITELPVTLVSENPDNPRNHLRNLDETTESVREVGIILPIVVATVDAYLRDRPNRADDLDEGAQYVVVDGHRRLEAARRVGMATIPVRVDNARVATDEALLEAAFVANYHRDDMTDLEEAHALQQLVEYYGSQTKASKRLGIAQSTLASKLSLLKLAPELQKDLQTGARKVEHVRNLGKLSPEEQKAKADERAEAARARTRSAPAAEERSSGNADYHGVIIPDGASSRPAPATSSALPLSPREQQPSPQQEQQTEHVPEPRTADVAPAPLVPPLKRFPYDNGSEAAQHLLHKMDDAQFVKMMLLLIPRWEQLQQQVTD